MLNTQNDATVSKVYTVLSQPKIPPLDLGGILSIHNNDFHPKLNQIGANDVLMCANELRGALLALVKMRDCLAQYPIRMNEFGLALNYLYGYEYILNVTLDIPVNARMVAYAQSRKAVQS